jgi:hypothetical protein
MDRNSERTIAEDEISKVFIQIYLGENKNIQKRFDEQVVTGNIVEEGEGFKITQRGRLVVRFYEILTKLFVINNENIYKSSE